MSRHLAVRSKIAYWLMRVLYESGPIAMIASGRSLPVETAQELGETAKRKGWSELTQLAG